MPSGRCSGCGHADSSKKVAVHIANCMDYLQLHLTSPARCLSPAEEAERHRAGNTVQARAESRDQRLRTRFAQLDRHARSQAERWKTPKDLLDD